MSIAITTLALVAIFLSAYPKTSLNSVYRAAYVLPDWLYTPDTGYTPDSKLVYGGDVLVRPVPFGYLIRPSGKVYTFQYEQVFRFGCLNAGYNEKRTVFVLTEPHWVLLAGLTVLIGGIFSI